jgi:hypothetical protein
MAASKGSWWLMFVPFLSIRCEFRLEGPGSGPGTARPATRRGRRGPYVHVSCISFRHDRNDASGITAIDEPEGLELVPLKAKSISFQWELMFTRSLFETDDIDGSNSDKAGVHQKAPRDHARGL